MRDDGRRSEQEVGDNYDPGNSCNLRRISRSMCHQHKERDSCPRAKQYGGADQMQARAMNRALWPATIGYWMDKMLAPVFSDDAVADTRWFFAGYVSGRGAVAKPGRCRAVRAGLA